MPDLDIIQYDVRPALGRHLVRDPRSLAYRTTPSTTAVKPVEWLPKAPVLDQQNLLAQGIHTSSMFLGVPDVDALGSCTANAATCLVSVLHTPQALDTACLDVTDAAAAQAWAINLYSDATHRDQWNDLAWPHSDCGSSGLGVAKALHGRGLIDHYVHATTAEELCALLQDGPVLMGAPWYDAWFEPTSTTALLDDIPHWDTSPLAGGHEVCITALETVTALPDGGLDYARTILRARNSWSPSWGDQGEFRLSLALYQKLRDQIDLVQPRLDIPR